MARPKRQTKEERRAYQRAWERKRKAERPNDYARSIKLKEERRKKRALNLSPEELAVKAARLRAYRKARPDAMRESDLRRTGWSIARYEEHWAAQNGRCDICKRELVRSGPRWQNANADHDHTKRIPRGLLCPVCNKSLGHFERNAWAFIEYLRKWGSL